MPAASSLLPWFAPRLSRPMMGVLNNLGHEMHYTRGEVLYESPGFFRPLMLVRRGIVARALMDPLLADPLLVSLSGPRALCGSCETLYVQDRMVRRHWCMTSVDVHVVNADLLLRICDQNPLWQRELSNYSAICALSDRLGMLVTHATSLEERLGVLMIASSLSTDSEFLERFRDPSVEWVPLPVLPSMHVAKVLLSANRAKIRGVLQRWLQEDTVRWRSHKILLSRPRFAAFWNRVEPVLRTVAATEPGFPIKMPVRDLELPGEL